MGISKVLVLQGDEVGCQMQLYRRKQMRICAVTR